MKQRIASVMVALGLALGMVVVAEAPASAASACRTSMHVVYSGSTTKVRVDNDGCFRVQGLVRVKTADNRTFTFVTPYLFGAGTFSVYIPGGSTIEWMFSEVIVSPVRLVMETLKWHPLAPFQWRKVVG